MGTDNRVDVSNTRGKARTHERTAVCVHTDAYVRTLLPGMCGVCVRLAGDCIGLHICNNTYVHASPM